MKEDVKAISLLYDNETGLPKDQGYLECGLPSFLEESIRAMDDAWKKIDESGHYLRWDCDYCSLQSDINSAEVNCLISTEQAWYLREKYLRIERTDRNNGNPAMD